MTVIAEAGDLRRFAHRQFLKFVSGAPRHLARGR
ncbi:hypothetical protein [Mesorhizobium sp. M0578]